MTKVGLHSQTVADIRPHAGAWALNLAKQGWHEKPREENRRECRLHDEKQLAAKVIPSRKPKAAPKKSRRSPRQFAALNSVTMPGR